MQPRGGNYIMKKGLFLLLLVLLPLVLLLPFSTHSGITSAGEPDLKSSEWQDVIALASGQTVHMYMWGGNNGTNLFIDEWVAPRLLDDHRITLKRVPVTDIREMINKVLTEKQMKKEKGSADILWINGENFRLAMENGLLWGPFISLLPNYREYIDPDAEDLKYDFGTDTQGYEAPWGKAQFVMIYNSEKITEPPLSLAELMNFIRENPGRFTYPSPPDFTGSCFVRQVLLENYGSYGKYLDLKAKEQILQKKADSWDLLNKMKPYLWREGNTYPDSVGILDQLFANGEVWFTMNYNPLHAYNQVRNGLFPETTRTYVFRSGTFSNTHYLAIPFNAKSKAGAMVAINLLLSVEAQIEKFKPHVWGDGMVLDSSALSEEQMEVLGRIYLGPYSLPPEELEKSRVPEFSSQEIEMIEEEWMEEVGKK